MRVLYLMGQDRSGSTVLGAVLGSVSGYAHAGEVRHLWREGFRDRHACACGRPVPECEVWGPVVAEVLGEVPADPARVIGWERELLRLRRLSRILRGPSTGWPALEGYAQTQAALYRAFARRTGADVVVDSSKHPVHGAVVSRLPGVEARFVHLVRDPRAVAYSWGRGQPDPGKGGDGRMWRRPPLAAARAWVLANEAAARVRRRVPRGSSMLLRYERFMAEPERTLGRVLELMGDGDRALPMVGPRTADVRIGHAASGNPARFRMGPVELRLDDEWLDGQAPADRLLVTTVTLPFLRRYGYPIRVPGRRGERGAAEGPGHETHPSADQGTGTGRRRAPPGHGGSVA